MYIGYSDVLTFFSTLLATLGDEIAVGHHRDKSWQDIIHVTFPCKSEHDAVVSIASTTKDSPRDYLPEIKYIALSLSKRESVFHDKFFFLSAKSRGLSGTRFVIFPLFRFAR